MRALFVSAGNPVLGAQRRRTRRRPRLAGTSVGIDLYLNETTGRCDYVLPATTMYERDDFPLPFQVLQPTLFRQATEAVVAWRDRPARSGPSSTSSPGGWHTARWPCEVSDLTRKALAFVSGSLPRAIADAVIRLSTAATGSGCARRPEFRRLTTSTRTVWCWGPTCAGVLPSVVVYRGQVRLVHADIEAAVGR